MSDLYFIFDVESIGLHGEGFAVGGGVYGEEGNARWEFCFSCPSETVMGLSDDRKWVEKHVPMMEITHRSSIQLRMAFWEQWEKAKSRGAQMAGECIWPVEANFLSQCIADDAQRLKTAPYPCYDISSIMLAAGMDAMKTYERTESEKPAHNPLADSRQSARLLSQALRRINSP